MNLDDITSILRKTFHLNPQQKLELPKQQSVLILYRMTSSGVPAVILKQSTINDGTETKWEIFQDMDDLGQVLADSKSRLLSKNLTRSRIENLTEDGRIGAIKLDAAEAHKIESYMHRHWQKASGLGEEPCIKSFRLDDLLDCNVKKLKNPNQIDSLIHFGKIFKARHETRELELICE